MPNERLSRNQRGRGHNSFVNAIQLLCWIRPGIRWLFGNIWVRASKRGGGCRLCQQGRLWRANR